MSSTVTPADHAPIEPFDALAMPLSGVRVVEASAGTGKTFSIKLLYLRCLLELELEPREILVVTFTRAATAELRHRVREAIESARAALAPGAPPLAESTLEGAVRKLLAPHASSGRARAFARLGDALDALDQASIFTIHGFCQRVLARHAFESGASFDAELLQDDAPLRERIAADTWTAHFAGADAKAFARSPYARIGAVRGLVDKGLAEPDAPLVPAVDDVPSVEDASRRYERAVVAYREARRDWPDDEALFASVKRVLKSVRSFNALAALDEALVDEPSVLRRLPKDLDRASARALAALGYDSPIGASLFSSVDELADAWFTVHRAMEAHEAHAIVSRARSLHARETRERGMLTFNALIHRLAVALRDERRGTILADAIARTYRVAMIDECQDTDAVQHEIFRSIFARAGRPLVYIGDPKQSIYAFRGADVHAYVAAREAADGRYSMSSNFRSRPELVRTLDTLYRRATSPFAMAAISYPPIVAGRSAEELPEALDAEAPHSVEVLWLDKGADDARAIASDIVRALDGASVREPNGEVRALRPRDVAVLCSSHATISEVAAELRNRGVPAVATTRSGVFASDEASHVELLLRAALAPRDARTVAAAMLTPLFGRSPRALAELQGDDGAWDAEIERLAAFREAWLRAGIGTAMERFLRDRELLPSLLARQDGYRVVTNLEHVIELLGRVAVASRLGPEGLVTWLSRARAGEVELDEDTEERRLRLEHAGDAVAVMTLHVSKGLEFPVVYVLGMSAPRTAPKDPGFVQHEGRRWLATRLALEPEVAASARRAAYEEHARLAYVALTRAKLAVRVVVEAKAAKASSAGLGATALGRVLGGDEIAPNAKGESPDGPALRGLLERRFTDLRAESGCSVGLRTPPSDDRVYAGLRDAGPALRAPDATTRRFTASLSTSSFSGLVSGAEHARVRDRDVVSSGVDTVEVSDPLADVGGGTELGHVLHDALERLDFAADRVAISRVVAQVTSVRATHAEHVAALETTLARCLATPVLQSGTALRDVARARTARELEFQISVLTEGGLRADALAELFATEPGPLAEYAPRLRDLSFDALRGYLRGFIDLVFEHDGRYYVVDYKSNRLPNPQAYASDALLRPMIDSNYVLQYALYLLVVHRWLRSRLPDYAYETHVGGALYLFLRGMSPETGAGSGVFAHRPSSAFIEAFDLLLGAGGAS